MREPKIPGPGELIDEFQQIVPPPHVVAEQGMKYIDKNIETFQRDAEAFPKTVLGDVVRGAKETADGLLDVPKHFAQDGTKAFGELTTAPIEIVGNVVRVPVKLVSNLPAIVKTVLTESIDVEKGSYKEKAEKMRTITDFIPFI